VESDSPVSRRTFMQNGAAVAAGAFTILSPRLVRGSEANSRVSVGLIGSGGRGSWDAGIVTRDSRAQLTALCDKFPDRIDEAATHLKLSNPKTYTDFEKMLAAPDIDAVIIATPPFEHPRMLAAAVDAKKHVYCEKPMGVNLDGVKTVIAAGRRADPSKNIFVGFQQRYGPEYLEAYKRIQEGQLGPLTNARGWWVGGDPFKRKPYDSSVEHLRNWFCYKDYSGDIIVEQDCHNFDVLHWFLGARPISAVGYGGTKVRTNMDILDNLTLSFQFPDGMNVAYEANQLTPPGFSRVGEEFTGTKGVIETSRARMVHHKADDPKNPEVMTMDHDITEDAVRAFIGNIVSGKVENVAERSAISTLFAILGRTAIYEKREATWKGEFGDV